MVGRPDGDHEGVGGPHGKPNGEEEPEDQQLGAGGLAHVDEVGPDDVDHIPWKKLPQAQQNSGDVQIQEAQEGADKNQEGEDHKQQVERQSGALDSHTVVEVALYQKINTPGQPSGQKNHQPFTTSFS